MTSTFSALFSRVCMYVGMWLHAESQHSKHWLLHNPHVARFMVERCYRWEEAGILQAMDWESRSSKSGAWKALGHHRIWEEASRTMQSRHVPAGVNLLNLLITCQYSCQYSPDIWAFALFLLEPRVCLLFFMIMPKAEIILSSEGNSLEQKTLIQFISKVLNARSLLVLPNSGPKLWLGALFSSLGGVLALHFTFQVYEKVVNGARNRHAIAGTMFWMTAARSYEDYDGTTIYLTPPKNPDPSDAANLQIVELIRRHAIDLAWLNRPLATSWCKYLWSIHRPTSNYICIPRSMRFGECLQAINISVRYLLLEVEPVLRWPIIIVNRSGRVSRKSLIHRRLFTCYSKPYNRPHVLGFLHCENLQH